jgi:acyl-CoA reductase-like NAD-dependent aldehyde dehydrogenase
MERGDGQMKLAVRDKFSGEQMAELPVAGPDEVRAAVSRAEAAFPAWAATPAHRRSAILAGVAARLHDRRDEVATLICREAGKAWKYSAGEVQRGVETFQFAAEEAKRIHGETIPMDASPAGEQRIGFYLRTPLGVVSAITPFNFPLNLVAHKVAPALAVGAPIVVKPASATPIGALRLAEFFAETDLPAGMYQVLPVSSKVADGMARDDRFRKISFTGSAGIGWYLKGLDPKKRVTLELGGNAGVIVHADADLDLAAQRIAYGGYYQAGQSCISVQRVLVSSEVYDEFAVRLTKQVEQLKVGDPLDETVDVGPVITSSEVDRIAEWVGEAQAQGAEVLTGGAADGPFFQPTLISRTTPEMKVRCEEVFGPVCTITPYQTFEEALSEVNDSKYGLQAGVFTNDINRAFEAHRTLEVGGVIVNDVSAFRADQMPYGGSKESGFGREGLRFAMEEMTEPRIMVLSHVPL